MEALLAASLSAEWEARALKGLRVQLHFTQARSYSFNAAGARAVKEELKAPGSAVRPTLGAQSGLLAQSLVMCHLPPLGGLQKCKISSPTPKVLNQNPPILKQYSFI